MKSIELSEARQNQCRQVTIDFGIRFVYGPSTNCPADKRRSVSEKARYCNAIDCLADWDIEVGLTVSTSCF